ncbi:MAG: hypothetical protein OES24_14600 [Acidimicrobiia bacterium]|nr:hypothetical protein [Acidimicrobiia bacterium]
MSLRPRAVVVHRTSEFDEVLARHGTAQQAEFFLRRRGRSIDELVDRSRALRRALAVVRSTVPIDWRRAEVERTDLARFVFGPEDVIVVVGQDGLVANAAKYLDGQPVIGVDPEPGRNAGVLVTHRPDDVGPLLGAVMSERVTVSDRTLVEAVTDDGQRIRALNEVFVGHATHQSARYRIDVPGGRGERQSSSGLLAGTGTGSTGWLRSAWLERRSDLALPDPCDPELAWFVREAWPSPVTGVALTEGTLTDGERLRIVAEGDLVCFGDGIESDRITLSWGQGLDISRAGTTMRLVAGS